MSGRFVAPWLAVLALLHATPVRAQEPPEEIPADPAAVTETPPPAETAAVTTEEQPPASPEPVPQPQVAPPAVDAAAAAAPEPDALDLSAFWSPAWKRLWLLTLETSVASLPMLAIPVLGPLLYLAVRTGVACLVPLPGDGEGVRWHSGRARRFLLWDLGITGAVALGSTVAGVLVGGFAVGAVMLASVVAPFTVCLPFFLPFPSVLNRNTGNIFTVQLFAAAGAPFVMAWVGTGLFLGGLCATQGLVPLLALRPRATASGAESTSGGAPPASDEELEAP